jgi:NADPH:quinone reductase-like Zn-dependent oxidoreductase
MAGGKPAQIFQALLLGSLMSEKNGRKLGILSAKTTQKDLLVVRDLLEAGKVKSVIDKRYLLSESAEALRYLGAGHARGKIVITVAE